MKDDWLERELRRVLEPADASPDLKARLARIPQSHSRKSRDREGLGLDWRWFLGLGLASAVGLFALGIWIGGSLETPEPDALALFIGSDLGYMEELL